MKKIEKAVILCAGFGTRFMPYCKAVPKCMMPIVDTPSIEVICNECLEVGIKKILMVVGFNKEVVMNHFKQSPLLETRLQNNPSTLRLIKNSEQFDVEFVEQKELNGTAGATLLAQDFVGDDAFLLLFADDIMVNKSKSVSAQVIDAYYQTNKNIMGVQEVSLEEIVRYSSVEYSCQSGNLFDVTAIHEKPKAEEVKSRLSTLGRYVLKPEIFDYINKVTRVIGGEKYITDAFDLMAKDGKVVACQFEGKRYDTGNKLGYLKTVVEFGLSDKNLGEEFKNYLIDLIK